MVQGWQKWALYLVYGYLVYGPWVPILRVPKKKWVPGCPHLATSHKGMLARQVCKEAKTLAV